MPLVGQTFLNGSAASCTTAANGWESGYGGLTLLGLHYLPAWVRGPRRVALWAAGKILIHLYRCAEKLPREIKSYGVNRKC